MIGVESEVNRFFNADGGSGSVMEIELMRLFAHDLEEWSLVKRIGYLDRHHTVPFEVPPPLPFDFKSDLTSVPQMFTWLVPKTGAHLPAALLHDGLVWDPNKEPQSYVGDTIDRVEADRIFRDAMADLGTPLIRRWLIWTAVSLATVAGIKPRLRAIACYLTLVVVVVFGYIATLDLFDQIDVLPWMGDRQWWSELIFGIVMAVLIPAVLSLVWFKEIRWAGFIASIALAVLLYVTVVIAATTALYQVAERRQHIFAPPRTALKIGGTVVAGAITALTIWLFVR
ncbi:MAG: DUF1353 domain-containing protein [Actinomycetota bacterium]|nr:DUF1353 domain-containing protein [Actinomycetota bacterium]